LFKLITAIAVMIAGTACSSSSSSPSDDSRDMAKYSACTDPVAPRFKPDVQKYGYDCTYNVVISKTFRSDAQRIFKIDYEEFKGLEFTLPESGVTYPLRVEFELLRDENGRVWGFSIAADRAISDFYILKLPTSAISILPPDNRSSRTLGITVSGGSLIRMQGEMMDISASDGSISIQTVLSGFITQTTIRTTRTPPDTYPLEVPAFDEDTISTIKLLYTDPEDDIASACEITELNQVEVAEPCTCSATGECQVGIRGLQNYFGSASFKYSVTADSQSSEAAAVGITINPVNDAPSAEDIDGGRIDEGSQHSIDLVYADAESDLATTCTIEAPSHIDQTNCSCTASGVCTASYRSTSGYSGNTNISYTVTANGLTSEAATISLLVDNYPVVSALSSSSINEDTSGTINLAYTDANGHLASSCELADLQNLSVTASCSCDDQGSCTVGIIASTNFNGNASFKYRVTANDLVSEFAVATVPISPVDDAPGVDDQSFSLAEDGSASFAIDYSDIENDAASSCQISNLTNLNQTVSCQCTAGVCSWTAAASPANYFGVASFGVNITANGLTSTTRTITVNITSVDDAPVSANVDAGNINEDTNSGLINLSYTDIEGHAATTCTTSNLSNLTIVDACACVAGLCQLRVRGTSNYNGAASLNYTVTANGLTSNTSSIDLDIDPVDDAPVGTLTTPSITISEDIESDFIELSYTDVESNQATTCSVTNESHIFETTNCACSLGTCTVKVTSTPDYFGSASFDYTVTANGLTSATKTVSFTIIAVDDAPVANDIGPVSMNEDITTQITLDYDDIEGHSASACAVTPANADISVSTACSCTAGVCRVSITGALNYNGAASFTYTVTANGLTSNSATATLSINAVDDAPVAQNITPSNFDEESISTITLAYNTAYSDVDGDNATSCSITATSKVTVSTACGCTAGTCTVGVTGNLNQYGAASVSFRVQSNGLNSNTAVASFSLNQVNDLPVASNTSASMTEDVASLITLTYQDVDDQIATACSVSNVDSNISVSTACACDGFGVCKVGILGDMNYFGAASFDFNVTTGSDTSNNATASLTIQAVDDAPVTADITPAAFNEDTASTITLSYSDVESHLATSCAIISTNNVSVDTPCACVAGVCTVGIKGTLNYNGSASFTYRVTANSLQSNTSTASLTINAVDDAPVANNFTHSATILEESEGIVTLQYTDVESDQATSCSVTPSANITISTGCSCSSGICTVGVTGNLNYFGTTNFTFSVVANGLTSNTATATLTITNVNDAPTVAASNSTSDIAEDTLSSGIPLPYQDVDNDLATTCTISNQSNLLTPSTCTCTTGTCRAYVQGTANYFGAASFDFTVTANGQTSNTGNMTLNITSVDDAPVTTSFTSSSVSEDTISNWISFALASQYTDVESDQATTCATSNLTNLTVTDACTCNAGTCQVKIRGTTNFNGSASFRYTVTSNGLTSNSSTVSITIDAVDDAPDAHDVTWTEINEDTDGMVTLSYSDIESDKATSCVVVGTPANLTILPAVCSCNGAGVCTVAVRGSPQHWNGETSLDFKVLTGAVESDVETALVRILPVDDAPIANNFTATAFNEDVATFITLDYTEIESDLATTCTVSSPTNISIVTACACATGVCTVRVQGSPTHYNGSASFNFTVYANGKTSNQGIATLNINPVNDAPALNTNAALSVIYQSTNNAIGLVKLNSSDVDDTDANIIYSVVAATSKGTLYKNGVSLGNGDTFSDADVGAGLVTYSHTAGDYTSDNFTFTVRDDDSAYATTATVATPATFTINIIPAQVNCADYVSETSYQIGGDGSVSSPYQICNAVQIDAIADACTTGQSASCSKHFIIRSNIDMQDIGGFVMIGASTNKYTGTFDGDGKTISNLSAGSGSTNYVGLFAYTGSAAQIKNLIVKGTLTGQAYVGGVVGYNEGTLNKVGFDGTVSSSASGVYIGGLVGYHSGTIQNSFARGSVSASSGSNHAGGLVGRVAIGTISTSYSTAAVTSSSQAGGFVGSSNSGTYSCNYWETTGSGRNNAYDGTAGSVSEISGLTAANMKLKASYCANFDFVNTWRGYDYVSVPRLSFEATLLDCVAAGSHFYDTDSNGSYDACYYPAYSGCESGNGMGVDSNLDGALDACVFIGSDNATCSTTCSANTNLKTYSATQTAKIAARTSLCEFAVERLIGGAGAPASYNYWNYSETTFYAGTNLMNDIGCMRSDNPDYRFFDEDQFIVTSTGSSGISQTSPASNHPFIQPANGGHIRRVCGCVN
jgi:hypothetical protein